MNYADIEEDYRNEQAYHNSLSTIPRAEGDMVPRFWKGMDCPDSITCDVVYIDRTTGKEVMRYDGADPANTRFDYGATPDADIFARKGLNIKELVHKDKCVVTDQWCAAQMRMDYTDYYDYDYDHDDFDDRNY